ncbi:MAG: hypothetical protein JXQ89_20120 [Pelagimonas sp.]
MLSSTTLKRHAGLVDDMATAQGLDLEEQMLRGNVDMGALEDAVLRCTSCDRPTACAAWLEKNARGASTPPGYCRNQSFFNDIKRP